MLSYNLLEAILKLRLEAFEPQRIEISKKRYEQLMQEISLKPDPAWNPKDGDEVGKFADIPMFINNKEEFFSVLGVHL